MNPHQEYFNLKKDIYGYVEDHWYLFSQLNQFISPAKKWKKSFLDALSHSNFFQNGQEIYKTTGYWKLTIKDNPWIFINKDVPNVIYTKEDIQYCSSSPLLYDQSREVMRQEIDNFNPTKWELRDNYTKTFDFVQQQLNAIDYDSSYSMSFAEGLYQMKQSEKLRNTKQGVCFLMNSLNEDERLYNSSDKKFSGSLFFQVVN